MKKTISFDLWNTLIVENPTFKDARLILFQDYSNKSEEECDTIFRRVKQDLDGKVRAFGIQFTSDQAIGILANELGIDRQYHYIFRDEYYRLFLDNSPRTLAGASNTLTELKKKYRLVISSNTVFLPGHIMKKALSSSILSMFDKEYFSDEVEVAKPNPAFFHKIQTDALTISRNIIHVGASRRCDIDGALVYGLQTIQITPGVFPKDLEEKIEHKFNTTSIYYI